MNKYIEKIAYQIGVIDPDTGEVLLLDSSEHNKYLQKVKENSTFKRYAKGSLIGAGVGGVIGAGLGAFTGSLEGKTRLGALAGTAIGGVLGLPIGAAVTADRIHSEAMRHAMNKSKGKK